MGFKQEDAEAYLVARHYMYTLFQNLLGNEPSEMQMSAIDETLAKEAAHIVSASAPQHKALDVGFLGSAASRLGALPRLRSEYTKLFFGPGNLPAPPWESIYVGAEKVLFSEDTLKVREFYWSCGFLPQDYPCVADDHVSIELDFLANLARQAFEAYKQKDTEQQMRSLTASKNFLEQHLRVWVEDFANDLFASGVSEFYADIAQNVVLLAQADAAVLSEWGA